MSSSFTVFISTSLLYKRHHQAVEIFVACHIVILD